MDHDDLSTCHLRAWEALLRSHGALVKALYITMAEARCEVGLDTYEVLLSLEQAPNHRLTMGELAGTIMLSPSGVTRMVDRLEKLGYVERVSNPQDKRSFYTVVTAAGIRAREEAWPVFRKGIREHFATRLSDQEADALTDLLLKFVKSDVGAKVFL